MTVTHRFSEQLQLIFSIIRWHLGDISTSCINLDRIDNIIFWEMTQTDKHIFDFVIEVSGFETLIKQLIACIKITND